MEPCGNGTVRINGAPALAAKLPDHVKIENLGTTDAAGCWGDALRVTVPAGTDPAFLYCGRSTLRDAQGRFEAVGVSRSREGNRFGPDVHAVEDPFLRIERTTAPVNGVMCDQYRITMKYHDPAGFRLSGALERDGIVLRLAGTDYSLVAPPQAARLPNLEPKFESGPDTSTLKSPVSPPSLAAPSPAPVRLPEPENRAPAKPPEMVPMSAAVVPAPPPTSPEKTVLPPLSPVEAPRPREKLSAVEAPQSREKLPVEAPQPRERLSPVEAPQPREKLPVAEAPKPREKLSMAEAPQPREKLPAVGAPLPREKSLVGEAPPPREKLLPVSLLPSAKYGQYAEPLLKGTPALARALTPEEVSALVDQCKKIALDRSVTVRNFSGANLPREGFVDVATGTTNDGKGMQEPGQPWTKITFSIDRWGEIGRPAARGMTDLTVLITPKYGVFVRDDTFAPEWHALSGEKYRDQPSVIYDNTKTIETLNAILSGLEQHFAAPPKR